MEQYLWLWQINLMLRNVAKHKHLLLVNITLLEPDELNGNISCGVRCSLVYTGVLTGKKGDMWVTSPLSTGFESPQSTSILSQFVKIN